MTKYRVLPDGEVVREDAFEEFRLGLLEAHCEGYWPVYPKFTEYNVPGHVIEFLQLRARIKNHPQGHCFVEQSTPIEVLTLPPELINAIEEES